MLRQIDLDGRTRDSVERSLRKNGIKLAPVGVCYVDTSSLATIPLGYEKPSHKGVANPQHTARLDVELLIGADYLLPATGLKIGRFASVDT